MKMENLAVNTIKKKIFIEHEKEGTYFTLPFSMPADTESMTLTYQYANHTEKEKTIEAGSFVAKPQTSIIDLGLIAPDGRQVGASGSNKTEISISETYATPGYKACALIPGEWQIIIGAYKVAAEGVEVTYTISFSKKYRRLFKGDLSIRGTALDPVPFFTVQTALSEQPVHLSGILAAPERKMRTQGKVCFALGFVFGNFTLPQLDEFLSVFSCLCSAQDLLIR